MTLENCLKCGARVINREATSCWNCNASFTAAESAPEPPPAATSEAISAGPLSLSSEALSPGPPPQSHPHGLIAGEQPSRPEQDGPAHDNPIFVPVGLILLSIIALTAAHAIGLALLFILAIVPALVRASSISMQRRITGKRPLTTGETVLFFLTSLGVVMLIGAASVAAFFVTCFAIGIGGFSIFKEDPIHPRHGLNGWIYLVAFISGLTAGIGALVFTVLSLWPRKK